MMAQECVVNPPLKIRALPSTNVEGAQRTKKISGAIGKGTMLKMAGSTPAILLLNKS